MDSPLKGTTAEAFDRLLAERPGRRYVLTLYVTGLTPASSAAIANVKAVCERYLRDRYELEVVDLYRQPELARREQLVVAPTLVKRLPLPIRRLIGDFADRDRVLAGLDITPID